MDAIATRNKKLLVTRVILLAIAIRLDAIAIQKKKLLVTRALLLGHRYIDWRQSQFGTTSY